MPSITVPYTAGRPLITADVKVGRAQATVLVDSGGSIPKPMAGLFFVDSGADTTVVDRMFAGYLNLQLHGQDRVRTAMSGAQLQTCDVFNAGIAINGSAGTGFAHDVPNLRVIVADLRGRGFVGLIGLDVLKGLHVSFDGPSEQLTLYY